MVTEVLPNITEISQRIYIVGGRTCVGILSGPSKECILVDTGPGEVNWNLGLDAFLKSRALLPRLIINTHTHADHCGSDSYFVRNYQVRVACTPLEALRAKQPIIEPMMIFGAVPPENLMTKFFLFEPFEATILFELPKTGSRPGYIAEPGCFNEHRFEGIDVQVVALPGHTPGHIGVGKDGVLFVGDALIPSAALLTNPIPIYWDAGMAIKTLIALKDFVTKGTYEILVCAHGGRLSDPLNDLEAMLKRVRDVLRVLVERADQGDMSLDSAVDALARRWRMNLVAPTEYFLVRSAVLSYLTYLTDLKILRMVVNKSRLEWVPSTKRPSFEEIISQEMVSTGEGGGKKHGDYPKSVHWSNRF